jgi:SAM-dependent methyltransferase
MKIENCRFCNKNNLKEVLILKDMPFTDEFIVLNEKKNEYIADVKIGICNDCGIVQNLYNTNMDDYYNGYAYSVGSSGFALQFMEKLANKIKDTYLTSKNQKLYALEIGSGSGEQLKAFKNLGFEVIGIEPSKYLSDYSNNKNNVRAICDFFTPLILNVLPEEFKHVDCIVSSYAFDHIPYLNETLQTCKSILNDNGVLVVEVHDLDLIIERKEFCLFEHEHYYYLNRYSSYELFWENGFEILTFDLMPNSEKRGNSLLIVAQKRSEISLKMNLNNLDKSYLKSINYLHKNVEEFISKVDDWLYQNKDKTIVAYGAGGRGVITLAGLQNSGFFSYVVDRNPKGLDILTPKTRLPVYTPDKLIENKADLVFIFSYGYTDEIIKDLTLHGYDASQFVSLLTFV